MPSTNTYDTHRARQRMETYVETTSGRTDDLTGKMEKLKYLEAVVQKKKITWRLCCDNQNEWRVGGSTGGQVIEARPISCATREGAYWSCS